MTQILKLLRSQSVAVVALLVACGGTSYAATLAANSVGNRQLQTNAVTSVKVRNGTLVAADLRRGTLPANRLAPLRRGETIRGQLTGDFDTPAGGSDFRVSATFQIPLSAPPSKVFVNGVTAGETCTGSYNAPTAPRNTLCVYISHATNPSPDAGTHAIAEQSRWGFQLGWVAGAAGDTYAWTRWAFTEG